jgi:hypothetical protein
MSALLQTWLAEPIHMTWRGDDVIVLDIAQDSYACLVGASDDIRPTAEPGGLMVSPSVLQEMEAAGWFQPSPPASRKVAIDATEAIQSDLETSRSAVFDAGLHCLLSARTFRRCGLAQLLEHPDAPSRDSAAGPVDLDLAARLVSAFLSALPWIPDQGQCLQRAFMLRGYLARRGVAADWVFGVRTWPFGAHCWLQIGDVVLADDVDRIRGFTPIMVT